MAIRTVNSGFYYGWAGYIWPEAPTVPVVPPPIGPQQLTAEFVPAEGAEILEEYFLEPTPPAP